MGKKYYKKFYGSIVEKMKKSSAYIIIPVYFCATCNNCIENRCSIFKRYVIKDYNKCFYHSNYSPVLGMFVNPEDFERIAKRA